MAQLDVREYDTLTTHLSSAYDLDEVDPSTVLFCDVAPPVLSDEEQKLLRHFQGLLDRKSNSDGTFWLRFRNPDWSSLGVEHIWGVYPSFDGKTYVLDVEGIYTYMEGEFPAYHLVRLSDIDPSMVE